MIKNNTICLWVKIMSPILLNVQTKSGLPYLIGMCLTIDTIEMIESDEDIRNCFKTPVQRYNEWYDTYLAYLCDTH